MAELTEMENLRSITEIKRIKVEENDKASSQVIEIEASTGTSK